MTSEVVHDYLRQIGENWKGQGCAMELGCWLGASSIPLLEGLVKAGYDLDFWAFDRWKATEFQIYEAGAVGVKLKLGEDLSERYYENVSEAYDEILTFPGSIPDSLANFSGEPIEICIFDAPKKNPVFIKSIEALYKYWIPGVTILGLLDYYFYAAKVGDNREDLKIPVRFMEGYSECFTRLEKFPSTGPAFFRYEKELDL